MKSTRNVLNKIGLILTVMAAVLCFGIFTLSSASFSAYAKADSKPSNFVGPELTITKADVTYNLDDIITTTKTEDGSIVKGVVLPLATGTGLEVTAKSATGSKVDALPDSAVIADLGGAYLLSPEFYVGKYYVTYTAKENNVTTSKKIAVSFDSQRIEFEDITSANNKNIIPNYVNPGKTIKFGYPNIIFDGDADSAKSSSDASLGTLSVSVTTPSGTTTDLTAAGDTEKTFDYTIPTENAEGSYKVKYAYTLKATNQTISKSYSFNVISTDQFDPANDVSLKISSWSSSLDDLSLSVGVEKTLPTPTVVNSKDNSNISTYTTIKAEYYDTVNSAWVVEKDNITNFKFTPTRAADYRFTYTCNDFYGSTAATRISSNIKASLSSSTLGIKLVTADYDPAAEGFNKEEFYKNAVDSSFAIPTMVEVGSTYTLPAMAVTSYGDFELTPTFTIAGNTNDYNKTKSYTFSTTGTYTINYQIAYKNNTNQRVQRTFEVQVVSSLKNTDVTLDGSINGLATTVKAGNTLNFTVSATDVVTNQSSSLFGQTADADIEKQVSATIDGTNVDVTKNEDGTYSVEVPATTEADKVVKVTTVLVDDLGNTKTIEKSITVVNYSNDTTAPTLDKTDILADTEANYTFSRGTEVSVLPLKATDTQSNVSLNVTVKNGGNTILEKSVFSLKNGANNTATISADQFKFVISNSGAYYVTYTAVDANNNVTVFAYQIWSESNSKPAVTLSGVPSTANVGETIELSDVAKVQKDGEDLNYNTVLLTDPSAAADLSAYITTNNIPQNSILILVEGDFAAGNTATSIVARGDINLTAWAYGTTVDANAKVDAKITVTDTTAPQFTISGQGESDRNIPLTSGVANITVDWFATADDAALGYEGTGVKTLSIKATYQSDSEELWSITKSPDDEIEASELTFEATKNGRINVVYTVSDFNNNETTKTLVFYVGDCVAPVVSLGDQDLTKSITTGGEFVLDLSQLKAKDAGEDYNYGDSDMSFSIKLTQDGTDVSSKAQIDNNKWTVSELEAGTYVLTVSATDKAGNVSYNESRTFKVESKTAGKVTSTTVWGTILIILALVILAGVIFFFVRPTKSKVKVANANKKLDKKDEQSKEEKTE